MDNTSEYLNRTFQFTIVDGKVTAEAVVRGQHTETVHIPASASFAIGAGTVTETFTGPTASQTVVFTAEASNPALYQISSHTETVTAPTTVDAHGHVFGYSFTLVDGKVTAESVVSGQSATATHSHALQTPPGAQFAVSGTNITETRVQGHEVDVTTFAPSGTAGLYAVASHSETVIPQGSATTALSVEPFERDSFTFANGAVTGASEVRADGTTHAITDSHETFTQLAPGFVLETVTHGTHSHFEVFHDGNGDGIYTAIAHGDGTAVDLAGLQAQLTTIEPFL